MGSYLSPGVFITEKNYTQYIGEGSPTILGVVGNANKGEINKIKLVTSYDNFIKTFGNGSGYLEYVARFFFKFGGTMLKAIRVAKNSYFAGGILTTSFNWKEMDDTYENIRQIDEYTNKDVDIYPDIGLAFYAKSSGSWANPGKDEEIRITIYNKNGWDSTAKYYNSINYYPRKNNELLIIVANKDDYILEKMLVSLDPDNIDVNGNNNYILDYINNKSEYLYINMKPDWVAKTFSSSEIIKIESKNLNNGTNGVNQVPIGDILNAYEQFNDKNNVPLSILSEGGYTDARIANKIIGICESRLDCFGILNVPDLLEVDKAIDWKNINLITTTRSGLYYNHFYYFDPLDNTYKWLPPAIQIGGIIARNDLLGEEWDAPAGVKRGGLMEVEKLRYSLNRGDLDLLYMNYINPIVNLGGGPIVYGQKTLSNYPSALDRINVRRLMVKMEKETSIALEQFMFEPNTHATRTTVKSMLDDYFQEIMNRGGLEEFQVVCDDSNNTEQTQLEKKLIIDAYVRPVYTAEFIIMNFILTKKGVRVYTNAK